MVCYSGMSAPLCLGHPALAATLNRKRIVSQATVIRFPGVVQTMPGNKSGNSEKSLHDCVFGRCFLCFPNRSIQVYIYTNIGVEKHIHMRARAYKEFWHPETHQRNTRGVLTVYQKCTDLFWKMWYAQNCRKTIFGVGVELNRNCFVKPHVLYL